MSNLINGQMLYPISGAGGTGEVLGGISRTTIYELVNRGLLTKVNIGSRGFITAESLATYVESLKQQPTNTESPKQPQPRDSRC
jgi:hypothetical protein